MILNVQSATSEDSQKLNLVKSFFYVLMGTLWTGFPFHLKYKWLGAMVWIYKHSNEQQE